MIQPGLIPLQPNLDFMDTFEPFQGEDLGQGESMAAGSSFCPGQSTPVLPFHGGNCQNGQRGRVGIFPELPFLVVVVRSGKLFAVLIPAVSDPQVCPGP